MHIRSATEHDIEEILSFDPVKELERKQEISSSISSGNLYVYLDDKSKILGYIVLDRSFFHQYFITLIIVSEKHRKEGIALSLMSYAETLCTSGKLFTSTNQSNIPAQKLFERCGFIKTGFIEGLDDGDPEVIYIKTIQKS